MIVGVAVCPGAPLLVPGLAPRLAANAPGLVDRCAAAVATLRGVERILLLTSGPRARDLGPDARKSFVRHPPGTQVSSALLADSRLLPCFSGALAGAPAGDRPASPPAGIPAGVGVVVGAALLAAAGIAIPTTAVELGEVEAGSRTAPAPTGQDPPAPHLEILRDLVGGPGDRVGLLVIAEGTASRGSESPGGGHESAVALDASLAAALSTGDPVALATTAAGGRRRASDLLWTSGPSLGALAALCADRPPTGAQLLYDDAPFGVGYLVATWSWK